MIRKTKVLISVICFYTIVSIVFIIKMFVSSSAPVVDIKQTEKLNRLDSIINSNAGQNKEIMKQQDAILSELISIQNQKFKLKETYHEKITILNNLHIDNPSKFSDSIFNILEQRNSNGYFDPKPIEVD